MKTIKTGLLAAALLALAACSTRSTRSAGTRFHCESADRLTPTDSASRVIEGERSITSARPLSDRFLRFMA